MTLNRRAILAGLTGSAMPHVFASPLRADEQSAWDAWKTRFLASDGRVIDDLQGGVSHSEGQGYGVLLAQAFGDRAAFDRIEAWTREHLLIRNDKLMAWRWTPGDRPGAAPSDRDWHTATDGDLFRAWALMRAEVFSGWGARQQVVDGIAADIVDLCLKPDPRAPGEVVLTPGAEALSEPERLLFNPSYIMPRALRELGIYANQVDLVRAADHGETILAELAATGLVPDWTLITRDGFARPEGFGTNHGYDALRVALYLHWSGRAEHPALIQKATVWDGASPLPVVLTNAGAVLERSTFPGYRAIADLIGCNAVDPGLEAAEPYYPATLGLMSAVARRESGVC
jgi:endo-1,4-beta-D-glucanase Y